MELKMFKEMIRGMQQDVFMESLTKNKFNQIMILENQLNQIVEMLSEKMRIDIGPLEYLQLERIYHSKISKVSQIIR